MKDSKNTNHPMYNIGIFSKISAIFYLCFVVLPVGGVMIFYDKLRRDKLSETEAQKIESIILAPVVLIEIILIWYVMNFF